MKILIFFFSLILLAQAPAQGADAPKPNVAAGKALANKLCARCHAIGITGSSTHKKAPPFRSFASKWPLENLEEALAEGIVVGHSDMPEFELMPEQIADLLGYIATLPSK